MIISDLYMKDKSIKISLHRATELNRNKITAYTIFKDEFSNNKFPLFYNVYKPEYSFIAVPPQWLKQFATEADLNSLVKELEKSFAIIQIEKEKLLDEISAKYHKRQEKIKKITSSIKKVKKRKLDLSNMKRTKRQKGGEK